jgi:L-lactate dehydrogenase complex protein LldE
MMHRHWPHLFSGDRDHDLAEQVAARVVEFSAFVASRAEELPPLRRAGVVTYHDSCHMLRELRIRLEPRQLLARIDGLELVEARSAQRCCGFGGTFSVRYPELSVAMADAKLDDVAATGASTLVSCDGGCLLQLDGRARRTGASARGMHLATLLREAL